MSAIKNQDKVGLILFSDRIQKSIPPRKGRTAVMRLVREVLAAEETREGTDIASALRFLNNVQKRKAVVFLISDFIDTNFEKELRVTARHHDVICCPVSDPRELALVNAGPVEVQDPETGDLVLLDTASAAIRSQFAEQGAKHTDHLRSAFRKYKIDSATLSTDQPIVDAIRRLFHRRQMRVRRG